MAKHTRAKIQIINDLEIIDDIDFTENGSQKEIRTIRLSELQRLAGLGFTIENIAKILGIGYRTLKYYLEEPTIRDAWEIGKAKANAELAQTAFDLAKAGDTTMCIWLTKVHLGWSGDKAVENQSDRIQIYIPAQMSIKEWNTALSNHDNSNNQSSEE